jgi:diadenylate cyclase
MQNEPKPTRPSDDDPRRERRLLDAIARVAPGLDAIVRASQRELEAVEGVGAVRAREIREGLRRLQEHNLVDRYLNL